MNLLSKSIVSGLFAGTATFGGVFAWQYFRLLAQQPGVASGKQITSYPPSAAWITAAPWALLAFFVVVACAFLIGKMREGTTGHPRLHTAGNPR